MPIPMYQCPILSMQLLIGVIERIEFPKQNGKFPVCFCVTVYSGVLTPNV